MMLDKIYSSILESAFGLSMGTMWQHLSNYMKDMNEPYEVRKAIFFTLLERLIREGHAKLASNDLFFEGTINEQIKKISDAWPPYPSEDEMDDLDDIGMWFLAKAPGGIVWITPEGQEIWT